MPQHKVDWAEALEPGIREYFSIGYNRRASLMPSLFNVQSSGKDSEYFHSFGAVGIEAWDHFKTTGKVPSVSFDTGYKTTFTHDTFNVELPVQRELIEDSMYAQVTQYASQLGDSASLKRETDAANVFNNATSSTPVGGDGVGLCNDSHPAGPHKSATVDNKLALALSAINVATARETMMAFTDDVGNLVGVNPNLLLVPPELEDVAKNLTQATGQVGTANNDINPQEGRFGYIVWHYLTGATTWFMIDTSLMQQSLFWFDRVPLSIYLKNSDTTVFATYVARMRYSYGWRDWRWVLGSVPA